MAKLNFKIVGKEEVSGDGGAHDHWNVEWTHSDGPVPDYEWQITSYDPSTGKPKWSEVVARHREVVGDLVSVPRGTPISIVMQICEEKRDRLAANLRVEP